MIDRPSWVHCIQAGPQRTFCGRSPSAREWLFMGIEHAQAAVANETRLQPCEECLAAGVTWIMAEEDRVALVDLDGTVADYDKALADAMRSLQAPNEPPYQDRYTGGIEPPYIEARRKMVQRTPGFWRGLAKLDLGFHVIEELREAQFQLHVLTKGPQKNGPAWGEKLEWCIENLPDATVTVTGNKSLVYGRVLFDDFPPYFIPWLKHRPRGLVICIAHPWNEDFAPGGKEEHPNVIRYDGTNREDLRARIRRAAERASREAL